MDTPEFLSRTLDKLDAVEARLDEISNTLIRQESLLAEHIRRTEILELELKPIKSHVAITAAVIKIVAGAGVLLSILLGIKELVS